MQMSHELSSSMISTGESRMRAEDNTGKEAREVSETSVELEVRSVEVCEDLLSQVHWDGVFGDGGSGWPV